MHRTKLPYFFLGLSVILALLALFFLIRRAGVEPKPNESPRGSETVIENRDLPGARDATAADVSPTPQELGLKPTARTADELVGRIAQAIAAGDSDRAIQLIGEQHLTAEAREQLVELSRQTLRLIPGNGIQEIGELELNRRSRWAIEFENAAGEKQRLLLDLTKTDGEWSVDSIKPSLAPNAEAKDTQAHDSLDISDAFVRAVVQQNFEAALNFVDSDAVSDAKIAALCILFEEGTYHLRHQKPLRALFTRGDTAGYLVNLESPDESQSARFGLTLRHTDSQGWQISEINLDQLLSAYASRVAGGDVYYSPLVKSPSGGDTLALYFEFDDDHVDARTRRQLEIVASILKSDSGKKITLSGHTDALGSDPYNDRLSASRAQVVRNFLADAGVDSSQIIMIAKGASQPRRPNVTESGEDNPLGRRANRRTEIYLDF